VHDALTRPARACFFAQAAERAMAGVTHDIGDTQDRITFMREHLRAAQAELSSADARAAAATAAAAAEHDARCLVTAAVSSLDADDGVLSVEAAALGARAAALSRELAAGEARLAGFRDAFEWSAAQLATWAAAAAAQDEDALALEAYTRADEARGAALRRRFGCTRARARNAQMQALMPFPSVAGTPLAPPLCFSEAGQGAAAGAGARLRGRCGVARRGGCGGD
jgi:hypothetical protein